MTRRELLELSGLSLLYLALPGGLSASPLAQPRSSRGLFFDRGDVNRIRRNARTPLLAPHLEAWLRVSPAETRFVAERLARTRELNRDLRFTLEAIQREGIIYIVTQDAERRAALETAIRVVLDLPDWDYLLDGNEIRGLQRASLAVATLLFAREALGDTLEPSLEERMLADIAEKGCVPCYRTLQDMRYPAQVTGWRFEERHDFAVPLDMRRWPEILGQNNLKAIPVMGLGLGALALAGRDTRTAKWLDMAETSARDFLALHEPDGSYFEGISYVAYAMRSIMLFLEAHYRLRGDIDWTREVNFEGLAEFIVCMQTGRDGKGAPEVVNFSDASYGVPPAVPFWIANRAGVALAQYAGENVSAPPYFADFLWYRTEQSSVPPGDHLLNRRFDLDWIVCRSGWAPADNVLAFRSGGPANHEHADRNSFLFKAYDERLLNDHYGAAYTVDHPRWLLRLTEAHNAVLVDGEGHQYHEGQEGTNEGLASAHIEVFEDGREDVWWVSDATHGYALVNPDIRRVRRSVLYLKPDVIVLLDELEKQDTASTLSVRFHPDNRDGHASLHVTGPDMFEIRRPKAHLSCRVAATVPLRIREDRLEVPPEEGQYPFIEVLAAPGATVEVLTVLSARPVSRTASFHVAIERATNGWDLELGTRRASIDTSGPVPELRWR
jgi:hypothetical protein